MKELEALSREPHDFAVTAAKIARASMLWKGGEPADAEALMLEALTQWLAQQRLSTPTGGLEQDVAEIRRVVYVPKGGEIFEGSRWNAFSWPVTAPPFVIANPEVRVKLHDGEVTRVTLVQMFRAADKVLFFDTDQLVFLKTMISKLGGTQRRMPQNIMETPNQPVGASMQILQLWNKFFHARPGHWGGWELETYPIITEIEFADGGRTRAAARVTIGYSGATVELEKEAGTWGPKRLTGRWVT